MPNLDFSNIILIGMPGAGKSTIGVVLAKEMAYDFVDTDMLIQISEKKPLQQILDESGYMGLRAIEEQILLKIDYRHHVIATGGSAAYSARAMEHLKKKGVVVFLRVEIGELGKRIFNFETRGIAKSPEQSFEDLFEERQILYKKYADLTIDGTHLSQEQISVKIHYQLKEKYQWISTT